MVSAEYANAYSEVLGILKYISREDYEKIPKNRIEVFEVNSNKEYNFDYDPEKTLDEQNVSKRTKAIIGLLFRDYWATEIQKNKIIAKQNYDRMALEEKKREKYNKDNISNIKKFNKNFEKLGGRVLRKTDPIVKILDLHDTFHYHEDYIYIIPGYSETFDFVNKKIEDKLIRLNSIYDEDIKNYYLGIFTTIYTCEDNIKEELNEIIKLQSNYDKKFEKIIIIFIDKLCEFDLLNNTYNIIENTNEQLNNISIKTYEELSNQ